MPFKELKEETGSNESAPQPWAVLNLLRILVFDGGFSINDGRQQEAGATGNRTIHVHTHAQRSVSTIINQSPMFLAAATHGTLS